MLLTAAAFLPSLSNGFTNWDDGHSVVENAAIREFSPRAVAEMFTDWRHERQDFYKPLVLFTHAVEYRFFGLDPRVYHLTNLLLHLASVALVFRLVLLLGLGAAAAFAAAALFGVHPMHVESVAWVAQRKDVLYAFFFLLSLIQYVRYRKGTSSAYFLSLFFFLVSLLAKPMAVTLAPVLFLFDWLERRRPDARMFLEKAPFFALSLAFGVLTLATATATQSMAPALRLMDNLGTMSDALVFYFKKLVAPVGLSSFYAIPGRPGAVLPGWPDSPVLVLIGGAAALALGFRSRLFGFGFLFFLVTLLPTLRLASAAFLGADHYTYIPYLGLFIPAAALFARLAEKGKAVRAACWAALALILLALSALTWQRCGVWKDSETLWMDVLRQYHQPGPGAKPFEGAPGFSAQVVCIAYSNLGHHYLSTQQHSKAVEALSRSIDLAGNNVYARLNRGLAYAALGEYEKASADYDRAAESVENIYRAQLAAGGRVEGQDRALEAKRRMELATIFQSRGTLYDALGRHLEARAEYGRALDLRPEAETYNDRGSSYAAEGFYDEAIADFQKAVELLPDLSIAHDNLRLVLELREKRKKEGVS